MRHFLLPILMLGVIACGTNTPDPDPEGQCRENFAGCTELQDLTADDASRTIRFGDALGNAYAPKCIQIKAGQTVTFEGDFAVHPLAQACGLTDEVPNKTEGSSEAILFEAAGDYGYFCTAHGNPAGGGMAGRIRVVE